MSCWRRATRCGTAASLIRLVPYCAHRTSACSGLPSFRQKYSSTLPRREAIGGPVLARIWIPDLPWVVREAWGGRCHFARDNRQLVRPRQSSPIIPPDPCHGRRELRHLRAGMCGDVCRRGAGIQGEVKKVAWGPTSIGKQKLRVRQAWRVTTHTPFPSRPAGSAAYLPPPGRQVVELFRLRPSPTPALTA